MRKTVRYIDEGAGPVILFLHGLLFDSEVWRALISVLSRRYRCIALDFPGHGDTPRGSCSMSMDALADWTRGFLDGLGVESCHVVGFSMGGFVGLRLANAQPARVRTLCLVGSSAGGEPIGFSLWHTAVTLPGLALARVPLTRWAVRPLVRGTLERNFFAAGFVEDSALGQWRMDRLMDYCLWPAVLATWHVLWRPSVVPELHRLTQPMLVVRGELDAVRKKEHDDAAVIVAHAKNARCVVTDEIPGCGHAVPVEKPEELLALYESFLDRAEPDSP